MSMTAAEDLNQFYNNILGAALAKNSESTLRYLIERGVSVKHLRPTDVVGSHDISIATLEFLFAHGWDINWRGDARPFLWFTTSNGDMVAWCLEHGASVIPSNQKWVDPRGASRLPRRCDPVLERAAMSGSVATFELLRSKGAPLGRRTLHRAVEIAAWGHSGSEDPANDTEEQRKSRAAYTERMGMVRHLLDVIGLDVNAPDQPPGRTIGMHSAWGTPICYIPGCGMPHRGVRELTWLLLDRGADPTPALKMAKTDSNTTFFVEAVNAWKAQNGRDRSQRIIQSSKNSSFMGSGAKNCCMQ